MHSDSNDGIVLAPGSVALDPYPKGMTSRDVDRPHKKDALSAYHTDWDQAFQLSCVTFAGILFLVTWRLWLQHDLFPKVPLVEVAGSLPYWIEPAVFAVTALALLFQLVTYTSKPAHLTFIAAACALVLADQHRLQPWLFQLILLSVLKVTQPAEMLRPWCQRLVVSVYVFSAVSKLDYQFLHTQGQQFIQVLLGYLHVDLWQWSATLRIAMAAVFPIAELLIGVCLLRSKWHVYGGWAAIGLHAALLAILGPWGLNHHLGVLVWNVFLIVQIGLLFLWPDRCDNARPRGGLISIQSNPSRKRQRVGSPEAPYPRTHSLALRAWICRRKHAKALCRAGSTGVGSWRQAVATAIVCFPLLEMFGLLDHWPAWQLYAPRNSRVRMLVLDQAVERLPHRLEPYLERSTASPFVRIDLDRWSLEALSVPVYPQDRFQLGVAWSLAERYDLKGSIQINMLSVSDRFTGERDVETLRSESELHRAAQRFRLNARPAICSRASR